MCVSVEECEGMCEYVCMCVEGEDEGVWVGMRVCQCECGGVCEGV